MRWIASGSSHNESDGILASAAVAQFDEQLMLRYECVMRLPPSSDADAACDRMALEAQAQIRTMLAQALVAMRADKEARERWEREHPPQPGPSGSPP